MATLFKRGLRPGPKVSILGRILNAAIVLTLGHVLNGAIGPCLRPRLKSAVVDQSVL